MRAAALGWRGLVVAVFAIFSIAAASSDPLERLADPVQEARARALFKEVRCLVCQNESIDDSEATLAADLRRAVRGEVSRGRSDREIKRYLTDRYGEFVLLKPAFSWGNAALWLVPFAIVAVGGLALIGRGRRAMIPVSPLSDQEEAALAALGQGSASDAPHEKRDAMALEQAKTIGVLRSGN